MSDQEKKTTYIVWFKPKSSDGSDSLAPTEPQLEKIQQQIQQQIDALPADSLKHKYGFNADGKLNPSGMKGFAASVTDSYMAQLTSSLTSNLQSSDIEFKFEADQTISTR